MIDESVILTFGLCIATCYEVHIVYSSPSEMKVYIHLPDYWVVARLIERNGRHISKSYVRACQRQSSKCDTAEEVEKAKPKYRD